MQFSAIYDFLQKAVIRKRIVSQKTAKNAQKIKSFLDYASNINNCFTVFLLGITLGKKLGLKQNNIIIPFIFSFKLQ